MILLKFYKNILEIFNMLKEKIIIILFELKSISIMGFNLKKDYY